MREQNRKRFLNPIRTTENNAYGRIDQKMQGTLQTHFRRLNIKRSQDILQIPPKRKFHDTVWTPNHTNTT